MPSNPTRALLASRFVLRTSTRQSLLPPAGHNAEADETRSEEEHRPRLRNSTDITKNQIRTEGTIKFGHETIADEPSATIVHAGEHRGIAVPFRASWALVPSTVLAI